MRIWSLKNLLSAVTALLFVAAVAVVVWGLVVPVNLPMVQQQSTTEPVTQSEHIENPRVPDLVSLQKLAKRDIRQRLFDPPPKPEPVIPPKPPPTVRLMGTIVNATNSQAMITGAGGQVELKRVGDTVGDAGNTAVIREIHSDHIMVEHEGNAVRIAIIENTGRIR